MVITEVYEAIARATFASRGRPDHPLVILPSNTGLAGQEQLRESAKFIVAEVFGKRQEEQP
jgi:hypothetical protein